MARKKHRTPQAVAPKALAPSHEAAGTGRRLRGWMPSPAGPNRSIAGAPSIRSRARDTARNDWAGRAIPTRWSANLIGTGIIARPKTTDATLKQRLVELWDDWLEVCDADGILDGYGLQNMVARNWIEAGEVFVRVRARRKEDGLPVPIQLQILEADMVPMLDSTAPNGNEITSGIEFNKVGQRVAYWMHKAHPGDGRGNTGELSRIPASEVFHIYEPSRPGQLRGVSEFAPIMGKLRSVGNYDDAVLFRQEISNLFTGFVTRNTPTDAGIDPVTGMPAIADHSGVPMAAMEPGSMQELLPGESVEFSDPPDAGANYADFTRSQYQNIAAGTGLPYELLTGDLRNVSDRALRVIINEFRRHCQQRQWHILIPQLCRKMRTAWADAAYSVGIFNDAEFAEAKRVTWVPQGWAYIHPVQDVQAQKIAVEAGFSSRTRVITERGDDPEEIDSERAVDIERSEEMGLTFPAVDPNQPVEPSPAEKAAAERAKAEANLLLVKSQRESLEGKAIANRMAAAAQRDQSESALLSAKALESKASASAVMAKAELDAAESAARLADIKAAESRANAESEARIAALEAEAEAAKDNALRMAEAHAKAEEFANEQRQIMLATERTRADVALIERQAAELGLAELAK